MLTTFAIVVWLLAAAGLAIWLNQTGGRLVPYLLSGLVAFSLFFLTGFYMF